MAPPASQKLAIALAIIAALAVATAVAQYDPQDYVDAHNQARDDVGAGLGHVEWDDEVASYAASYAEERRGDCELLHSGGGGGVYGENLFWGAWGKDWTAADAVGGWVGEGMYYHYDSNECDGGHKCYLYKQVVWRATTSIGCSRVECDNDRGVFIVCNYHPTGDVLGERPY